MTKVRVVRAGGEEFTGEVIASDKIPGTQGGLQERFTVRRDDNGTMEYALPESTDRVVEIVGPPPQAQMPQEVTAMPGAPVVPGLEHLAPTITTPHGAVPSDPQVQVVGSAPVAAPTGAPVVGPVVGGRVGSAPPVGSSIGGQPVGGVPAAPPVGAGVFGPPPAAREVERRRPDRFMVQPKRGKPQVFHTRHDCSKVTEDAKRLEVDDDQIAFFELEICASCQRRDGQISWQEAISEAIGSELGDLAVKALQSNGFRVNPDVVER